MSGIFRPAFRMPQPVQPPPVVLSGAAAGGGAILPAHVPPAGATFAPSVHRSVSAALSGGAPAFGTAVVRVTLKPIPAGGSNVCFDAAVGQTGVKSAPLVAGGGAIHAPRVDGVHTFDVVGTLNVSGWTPRPATRRPRAATWPNLPKVEAPPWRLMVVTPDVARERARSLMAQRRRNEQALRRREAKRKLDRHLDEIVEAQIAHTIVRLAGEEA